MSYRRAARYLGGVAFGVTTACAAIVGIEDIADRPPGSGVSDSGDAGLLPPDAEGFDAGGDQQAADAPLVDRFVRDARPDTYCASVDALFCEDFDDPAPGFPAWGTPVVESGGFLQQVVNDAAVSLPGSLDLGAGAISGGDRNVFLPKQLPATGAVTLSLDLRCDTLSINAGGALLGFELGFVQSANQWSTVRFVIQRLTAGLTLTFQEWLVPGNPTLVDHSLPAFLSEAIWYHLDLKLDAATKTATLTTAGVNQSFALDPRFAAGAVQLYLGARPFRGPSQPWEVRVDNVVLR